MYCYSVADMQVMREFACHPEDTACVVFAGRTLPGGGVEPPGRVEQELL